MAGSPAIETSPFLRAMISLLSELEDAMATINIRNVLDDVYKALRVRAAQSNESMESYLRNHLTKLIEGAPTAEISLLDIRTRMRAVLGDRADQSVVDDFLKQRREDYLTEEQGMAEPEGRKKSGS
jgi:plasmid stability protein